jgi:hypothetical protein
MRVRYCTTDLLVNRCILETQRFSTSILPRAVNERWQLRVGIK